MSVPVWVETWQIECCQPELSLGSLFHAPLVGVDTTIRATKEAGAARWSDVGGREVEFVGDASTFRTPELTVIDVGDFAFAHEAGLGEGLVEGKTRLYADWHGSWPGSAEAGPESVEERITLRGRVEQVFLVPVHYKETSPRMFEADRYEDPVPVTSTTERREAIGPGNYVADTILLAVDLATESEELVERRN